MQRIEQGPKAFAFRRFLAKLWPMARVLHFLFNVTRGLAFNQTTRRTVMSGLIVGALGMVFVGVFLFWSIFVEHPVFFAIWWLGCGWLLLTAALLAIYDLLMVMRTGREARRREQRRIFDDIEQARRRGGD